MHNCRSLGIFVFSFWKNRVLDAFTTKGGIGAHSFNFQIHFTLGIPFLLGATWSLWIQMFLNLKAFFVFIELNQAKFENSSFDFWPSFYCLTVKKWLLQDVTHLNCRKLIIADTFFLKINEILEYLPYTFET